jgi:antitoxin component of MazEF toxin-antitoxin module
VKGRFKVLNVHSLRANGALKTKSTVLRLPGDFLSHNNLKTGDTLYLYRYENTSLVLSPEKNEDAYYKKIRVRPNEQVTLPPDILKEVGFELGNKVFLAWEKSEELIISRAVLPEDHFKRDL